MSISSIKTIDDAYSFFIKRDRNKDYQLDLNNEVTKETRKKLKPSDTNNDNYLSPHFLARIRAQPK